MFNISSVKSALHTFQKKVWMRSTPIIPGKWRLGMLLLMGFYVFIYLLYPLTRHFSLGSYYFDLGIMNQVAYNVSQGLFYEFTDPNVTHQGVRIGYHFDAILALFAPFYWIWRDAAVLIIGQSLALVSGALPVFYIARKKLGQDWLAFLFAFLYLNFYTVQFTSLADFHAVTLATPLFLWAFYFALFERFRMSFAMIFVSWLCKENVPMITIFMGLYFAIFGEAKSIKKYGYMLAGSSLIAVIVISGLIMPYFKPETIRRSSLFSLDIVENIRRAFVPINFTYLIQILFPFAFLSLLAPQILAIAAPQFGIIFLINKVILHDIQYHYTAVISPFIVISAIYGFSIFQTRVKRRTYQHGVIILVVLLSLYASIFKGPFYKMPKHVDWDKLAYVQSLEDRFADPNISISTTGHLAPHFSDRRYFHNFLFDFAYSQIGISEEELKNRVSSYENAEFVIIYLDEINGQENELVHYYYNHLKNNPKYQLIELEYSIEVYQRVN